MEFSTKFLQFSSPGASIYRLRVRALSERTTMQPKFLDFRWKSFLFESHARTVIHCRSDDRTSAASNFHIRLRTSEPGGWPSRRLIFYTQFPYLLYTRPDHGRLASGRLNLNCDTCLMDERVRTGIHVIRTVESIFPYLKLERKSEVGWTLRVVWTSCWNIWTDANWNKSKLLDIEEGPNMMILSSGQMILMTVDRPDGTSHRPNRWCSGL
jgi:hypothetical protein